MPMIDDVQMILNLLGWIWLQMWQGTIYCCSIKPAWQALGNSGLKKQRGAQGRHTCLSTRTCLPLARLFFPAPKYFHAPAMQALLHLDETKYHFTQAPGWPAMNFCRTFRNTALKEIGKIYTVQGRKYLLSFPAPHTCVFFCVLLSYGFSRLPQRESLLTVYIHSSYQAIFPGETRALHLQGTYALMGCKNNIECVNLSVEKPFHVRSQIHSLTSSLSVNNKITPCVSSALLLNTLPIKNLLSRGQEPPDAITRVQVGLGVQEHVPSPSLVSLTKVFLEVPGYAKYFQNIRTPRSQFKRRDKFGLTRHKDIPH